MPYGFAASVDHSAVILSLFVMLAAAKIMAEIFERLRQPAVVGEILAGIVIGPSLLAWVAPSELITVLAEFGVIFLLFTVGLETKPRDIFQVGTRALLVAVLGVIIPFAAGFIIAMVWDGSTVEAMLDVTVVECRRSGDPVVRRLVMLMSSLDRVDAECPRGAHARLRSDRCWLTVVSRAYRVGGWCLQLIRHSQGGRRCSSYPSSGQPCGRRCTP